MPITGKKKSKFPGSEEHLERKGSATPPTLHPIQTQPPSGPASTATGTTKAASKPQAPIRPHVSTPTMSPSAMSSISPKSKESVILQQLAKISLSSPLTAAEGEESDQPLASSKSAPTPRPPSSPTTHGTLLSPKVYQAFQQAKQPKWGNGAPPSPSIQVNMSPKNTGEGYLPILTKDPMVAVPVYLPGLGLQYVLTPMLPIYLANNNTNETGSPEDDVALTQLKAQPSNSERKGSSFAKFN